MKEVAADCDEKGSKLSDTNKFSMFAGQGARAHRNAGGNAWTYPDFWDHTDDDLGFLPQVQKGSFVRTVLANVPRE